MKAVNLSMIGLLISLMFFQTQAFSNADQTLNTGGEQNQKLIDNNEKQDDYYPRYRRHRYYRRGHYNPRNRYHRYYRPYQSRRYYRYHHNYRRGYYYHNYPYYGYRGYIYRYSNKDICNYQLVKAETNEVLGSFDNYTCKNGYDYCASERDSMNLNTLKDNYFCRDNLKI